MKKTLILSAFVAILASALTVGAFTWFGNDANEIRIEHIDGTPAKPTSYTEEGRVAVPSIDFTKTAEEVIDAVVHIQSTIRRDAQQPQVQREIPDPFRDFFEDFFNERERFGQPQQPRVQIGTGSGVIINSSGYIVTNNHVIDNAEDIQVTLYDNRTYSASVIGTDPNTDLAVIKIEADDLNSLPLVDSDQVKIGQWVMAVGNPLGLNSTVTAGIVSAKGRNINILRERYAIESFIQTDAAINRGNSGGALVNLEGGLVGINTAIASPTGAYAGYGFAVPSNIVSKVVSDLIEYGSVQRAVLGVMIRNVNSQLAEQEGLRVTEGAYIDSLMGGSAAVEAGLMKGDVIVRLDGDNITTVPELQEKIAAHQPGDVVQVTVARDDRSRTFDVKLKAADTEQPIASAGQRKVFRDLGAELQTLDKETAAELNLEGGVKVTELYPGKLRQYTNMRPGFIITKVDGREVTSVEELARILENKKGGVMVQGRYEDSPDVFYYGFGM